jgi:hypothetical protein
MGGILANYAQWMQFILALLLFVIAFLHLDNALRDKEWCVTTDLSDDYDCFGESLVWGKGDYQFRVQRNLFFSSHFREKTSC